MAQSNGGEGAATGLRWCTAELDGLDGVRAAEFIAAQQKGAAFGSGLRTHARATGVRSHGVAGPDFSGTVARVTATALGAKVVWSQ